MRQEDIEIAIYFFNQYPDWFEFEGGVLFALVGKQGATAAGQIGELVWCPVRYVEEDYPFDPPGWEVRVRNLSLYNQLGEFVRERLIATVFVHVDDTWQYRDINLEEPPSSVAF